MPNKPTYEELEKRIKKFEREAVELEKLKEILKEKEEFNSSLLNNCPIPIIVINPDTSVKYVNSALEELTEYSSKELIGTKPPYLWWIKTAQKKTHRDFREALQIGAHRLEEQFKKKNEELFWVEITSTPIRANGKTKYYLANWVDITKRKESGKTLLDSKERYRKLINEMLNGFALHEIICDEAGNPYDYRFLETNKAFEDMTGLKSEEIIGKTVMEVLPETEQYWIDVYGKVALYGKHVVFENYSMEMNKYFEVLAYSPKTNQFATVFTDITRRKDSEELLKKSEEKFRSMMESMKDCVYICSPEYRINYLNPAMASKVGYDAVGEFCYKTIYNNDKKCTWCIFDQIKKEKHTEYEVANPKDNRIYCVTSSPIDHSDGNIYKLTILRDITQRKRIEGKLKKWNEELEDNIKERTASLEDFNIALKVLLKKRDEDKNQIGENIYANFKSLIQPLINQLRNSLTINFQEDILDILESSIKEMTTPFSKKMSDPMVGLTPTEIQVASLVKDGKINKEISQLLNKSIRAVSSHRNNIRQKFGLKNKKINLRTYLLSID